MIARRLGATALLGANLAVLTATGSTVPVPSAGTYSVASAPLEPIAVALDDLDPVFVLSVQVDVPAELSSADLELWWSGHNAGDPGYVALYLLDDPAAALPPVEEALFRDRLDGPANFDLLWYVPLPLDATTELHLAIVLEKGLAEPAGELVVTAFGSAPSNASPPSLRSQE